MLFYDRRHAAELLVPMLRNYKDREDAVVAAIPRGGVVTGSVLAKALGLPLDVILTKKIGHPFSPEYAIGVVNLAAESIDEDVVSRDRIAPAYLQGEIRRIRGLLRQRYTRYRGSSAPIPLKGAIVIIVDDGIATGNTMMAAIRVARREDPRKIVAAVPVAPPPTAARLRPMVDEFICLHQPEDFMAIGSYYRHFEQVDDEEVVRLLAESASGGLVAKKTESRGSEGTL